VGERGSYNLGIYCSNISFFTQVELEMHSGSHHVVVVVIPVVNQDFV
jgi:hypothetical protein